MTTRNYEVVDRYGNPVDDDDILPDGGRLRVPLMFRDADTLNPLQRQVMADKVARRGFDDSACRNRPGPVYSDRSAAAKAYTDAAREAEQAWKMQPTEATKEDAASVLPPTRDALEGRARKEKAYNAMVASTCSAWRDLSPLFSGTDAAPSVRRDAAPLPPTFNIEEGRARKKAALDQMIADSCSAWRNLLP